MSEGSNSEQSTMEREFCNRRRISRYINRRKFSLDCVEEQVIPKCAPKQLKCNTKPFSKSARTYLEECCVSLEYKIQELRDSQLNIQLSDRLKEKLHRQTIIHKNKLQQKLHILCAQSPWKSSGKADLITNLSSRILSDTEKEALSLGLKFDTGADKRKYTEYATRNHKWSDSESDRGFIQGVTACYKAV